MKINKLFLLAFVSLIAVTNTSFSQYAIHSIIVASTNDTSIGEAAEKSRIQFNNFLRAVATKIDCDYLPSYLVGDDCKKESLMEILDAFECDTSDIVVFAYFGHGGRAEDETSEFPQMCLYGETQKNYVPLEYVKNRLAQHGARVTWVIGDCCNSYNEWIEPKSYTADALSPLRQTIGQGAEMDLYPKLFKEFTGVITMCASKKGTFGWCRSDEGMLFNNALTNTINHFEANQIIPGQPWQSVMKVVQSHFSNYPIQSSEYPGQTFYAIPQYKIEKRQIRGGSSRGRIVVDNHDKKMEQFVAQLYSSKDMLITKMKMVEDHWLEYFEEDATCRTLTPSGLPIEDKKKVKDYLKRVVRMENISCINMLNIKTHASTGKVVSMDVIEFYYEK